MPTRVFIVEDSPLFYQHLLQQISDLENVEIVGSAERESESIAAIENADPDVAIVDINLKEGTGINVVRAIRKKLSKARLRIVMMTSFSSDAVRRQCMALGADAFIDKTTEVSRIRDFLMHYPDIRQQSY